MTLEQALDTLKALVTIRDVLPSEDLILTIQFNTTAKWFSVNLHQLESSILIAEETKTNEGTIMDALILIAKQLEV